MQMPVRDYTYREFNRTMKEVLEYHLATMKGKLRVNSVSTPRERLHASSGSMSVNTWEVCQSPGSLSFHAINL